MCVYRAGWRASELERIPQAQGRPQTAALVTHGVASSVYKLRHFASVARFASFVDDTRPCKAVISSPSNRTRGSTVRTLCRARVKRVAKHHGFAVPDTPLQAIPIFEALPKGNGERPKTRVHVAGFCHLMNIERKAQRAPLQHRLAIRHGSDAPGREMSDGGHVNPA